MKIIFFDGVCGLCNGFVDFMLRVDKTGKFVFSPLQSDFAQKQLPENFVKDLKSVVFSDDGKIYTKSEAVIQILSQSGGAWKLMALTGYLPSSLTDKLYDLVAENRYRLFGKKETCRLPTPEERSRFVI